MRWILLILLLRPVIAVTTIGINMDLTPKTYELTTVYVEVEIDGSTASYPDCNITITKSGSTEIFERMESYEDYAISSFEFTTTGERTALIECEGASNSRDFEVEPNAQISTTISGEKSVGNNIYVYTYYEDNSNTPISGSICKTKIYIDGNYEGEETSYFTGVSYITTIFLSKDGNYELQTTCSADYYVSRTTTDAFSVDKSPVTISVSATSVSTKYGSTINLPFTVNPSDSRCSATLGTISGSSSYRILSVPVDFIGKKTATVTCSKTYYVSKSQEFTINSQEVPTKLDAKINGGEFYSFQTIKITPTYYTDTWEQVKNALCKITLNGGEEFAVESFKTLSIKSPPGPTEIEMVVSCEKYGYKEDSKKIQLKIKPIELRGTISYPPSSKEGSTLNIEVSLNPGIVANCTLTSAITSEIASLGFPKKHKEINGVGNFTITSEEIGKINFELTCSSRGYTSFTQTGQINIKLFSGNEEIGAAIVLTSLTAILAVSFILIKRWL